MEKPRRGLSQGDGLTGASGLPMREVPVHASTPIRSLFLGLVERACRSLQRWKASCAASLVRASLLRAYASPLLGRANVEGHLECASLSFGKCHCVSR